MHKYLKTELKYSTGVNITSYLQSLTGTPTDYKDLNEAVVTDVSGCLYTSGTCVQTPVSYEIQICECVFYF